MHRPRWFSSAAAPAAVLALLLFAAPSKAQLNIVINPNASLAGNAPALAAFNRAAAQWEARFSDPITVMITGELDNLGSGILGQASSVIRSYSYTNVRNAMIAEATQPNNGIVNSLPASVPTFTLPAGVTYGGNLVLTDANAKALGLRASNDGDPNDATITFSTNFNFDFDNSNGVTAGTIDFETVASHEIGHALGFTSWVDQIDNGQTIAFPTALDLFRFRRDGATDPATTTDFTNFPRNLVPGADTAFDDITDEFRMSTGVNGGDGNQASHWKADDITGINIGIMDPTLDFGVLQLPSNADYRALDLIGYNFVPVPEPASLLAAAVFGLTAAGVARRRRTAA